MSRLQLVENGPLVSAMGLGCMAVSEFFGARDDGAVNRRDGLLVSDSNDSRAVRKTESVLHAQDK